MAKTETNVTTLKINRGTYANIEANLSSIGENELIITTDKSLPVPDTADNGKVVQVNSSGEYELGTITIPSIPDITVATSGSGNAVTAIAVDSVDKHKLNVTKGSTFLTGNQTITTTVNSGTKADGSTSITGQGSGATSISVTLGDSGVGAGTYTAVKVNSKGIVVAGALNEEIRSKVSDSEYNDMSAEEKTYYNSTSQGGYHYPVKPSLNLAVGGVCYMEAYTG